MKERNCKIEDIALVSDEYFLRPRYDEVDQMGYVYHGNYVSYCHQARTELLRKLEIHDAVLEAKGIMMPVISFDIQYLKPVHYDELICIRTYIREVPSLRFHFEFKIYNQKDELVTKAKSTVVFVNSLSRKPMLAPEFVLGELSTAKLESENYA